MSQDSTSHRVELALQGLRERAEATGRTLEEYLTTLWALARPLGDYAAISVDTFLWLLEAALTAPVPPFDDAWRALPEFTGDERRGFAGWESQILRAIRDLREMAEAGTLAYPVPWNWTRAPRGAYWYSLTVSDFLEAAERGTFMGWDAGEVRAMRIPGPVAVMGEEGRITELDPSQIDRVRSDPP